MDETAAMPNADPPGDLAARPRGERAAACRAFLDGARAAVARAHHAGRPGDETSRAWAAAIDDVVRGLYRAAVAVDPPGEPVAVVAVGGYGRMELTPGSDLDLWLLVDREAPPDDRRLGRLAEEILYPLWDLKLQVGHAVRSIDEAIDLGRDDLTAATALLDARFVAGDPGPCERLRAAAHERLLARSAAAIVRRLADEKVNRHQKFGDTVYLLEPDAKNGEGAYRDLLVALWAAKARFRVADFDGLLALGQATPRQIGALRDARRFFLTVRTAAHLHARRRQDRLLFEVQEAIAPGLAPDPLEPAAPTAGLGVVPAVAPAVERLMQRYYLHAKAVMREGGRLLDRALEAPARRPVIRRVDASFVLWNGKLSTTGPEVFRDRPAEMVRIFRVARATGAEIYGHTRDLIAEACARPDAPERLAADPQAARDLMALLCDPDDAGSPSLLEQMHDLGLLVALMPEFGPCAGRVQHDIYHVFTVDQHSLYAVARLKAIARGALADALPTPTQAMREVRDLAPLYLGTLLHDVGKPLGKAHSETGARLAVTIARRLHLDEAAVARTELLVRLHLLLAHLSQRRDLDDSAMIAHLAGQLGDEETLRQLYLLTVADMSMVSPDNLTSWKERLLAELYARTLAHFRRGPDLAGRDHSQRVGQRRARAAALAGGPPEELAAWLAGLPDRYYAQTPPRMIARHVALSRGRGGAVAVDLVHRRRKGWSELTVIADDAPGLLAGIAGVLLAHRVDVLAARIASRARGGGPAEAIDVFLVRDRQGRALDGGRVALPRVAEDLARVVGGATPVEALLEERRLRASLPGRVTPAVATEVEVDNEVSADFTVVDVYTQDRPGVLYTITRTFAALGVDIHLSKVATEGSRVADVFYVRGPGGAKLDGPAIEALRAALVAALAALPL